MKETRKEKEKTLKIRIWGVVQGVGFRPFVAKLADAYGITGTVRNLGGLVEIVASGVPASLDAFAAAIWEKKPAPAQIVHMAIEEIEPAESQDFDAFSIVESGGGDGEIPLLPADLPLCPDCLRELEDPANARYLHPFISCMACGPRYSIIDRIPYDRDNTAMVDFAMCSFCRREYTDREARRYHAQTVSCHDCGPVLRWRLREPHSLPHSRNRLEEQVTEPLALAARLLAAGKIIAVKGVGGYHLACSPFLPSAVAALRRLKGREEKPFAVMFRDVDAVRNAAAVGVEEERLLLSGPRPIVLLERREDAPLFFAAEVCRGSRQIGAFLPSLGLHHLLLDLAGPLVMTSANRSDCPIIKDEAEIFALFENAEDEAFAAVFYHDRQIRCRLDDSVVRVVGGQPQMIRRSKGYVPSPLYLALDSDEKTAVFAAGGQLKAAFSLSRGAFAYVGPYCGDLDSSGLFSVYREHLVRMESLFHIEADLVVADLHPLYETTKFARRYAEERGIPLLQVQHHHAHVASVMAEHGLWGPVLGVAFDGTGYGVDGAIWGGEFLLCEGTAYERLAHLNYLPMLGGDASMREGWKTALCYGHFLSSELPPHLAGDERRPLVEAALRHRVNLIANGSMGRLFDAVAAFLDIQNVSRYEGECAIQLENAAAKALQRGEKPFTMRFEIEDGIISAAPIFAALLAGLSAGIDRDRLALGYHDAVAALVAEIAVAARSQRGVNRVALTGGVFQNRILSEAVLARLSALDFEVYGNVSVSPNDNGVCLGQNWLGIASLLPR